MPLADRRRERRRGRYFAILFFRAAPGSDAWVERLGIVLRVEHSTIREVIVRCRARDGVTVAESSEQYRVMIRRGPVELIVTVPKGVLEWFVDAKGPDGAKVSDWCDYEGYDDAAADSLARDMADDLDVFLSNALWSELRFVNLPTLVGKKRRLEWLVDGVWRVAVPLTPSEAD